MCYTSFTADGFTEGGRTNTLGDMKAQTGSNWVSLNIIEYQSTPSSTDIAPNTSGTNPLTGGPASLSSTEDDIREGIREARALGMKVMLIPHVNLYTGAWRADIVPDAGGAWFTSYSSMILKYARLAQENGLEMLCVGTEYVRATQHTYTPEWRSLISAVRRVYSGELVYAANWSGASEPGTSQPEYEQVEFWDALDAAGIDAYYPLTDSPGDSLPAFSDAVRRTLLSSSGISLLSIRTQRPVIITEVGVQSTRGALAAPWNYLPGTSPGAREDTATQKFYYRVMIEALGERPWCRGMFWWNWESVPSAAESTNYTPSHKPAAEVLKSWYSEGMRP